MRPSKDIADRFCLNPQLLQFNISLVFTRWSFLIFQYALDFCLQNSHRCISHTFLFLFFLTLKEHFVKHVIFT